MRNLIPLPTLTLIVACLASTFASSRADAQTEQVNLNASSASGNVIVFEDLPNTAWILGTIEPGDYFDFRRIVRRNNIETVVLDSPGGAVYEGLQIAAMIHDKGLSTFVPENALCASACAYLYFAGKERIAEGDLGVHQFFGEDDQGSVGSTQYTVSEIVGFLNEFDTPPMVFEYMFQDIEMYYFSDEEKVTLNRQSESGQPTYLQTSTVERFNITFNALLQAMEQENAVEETAAKDDQPENPSSEPEVIIEVDLSENYQKLWTISAVCPEFSITGDIYFPKDIRGVRQLSIIWATEELGLVDGRFNMAENKGYFVIDAETTWPFTSGSWLTGNPAGTGDFPNSCEMHVEPRATPWDIQIICPRILRTELLGSASYNSFPTLLIPNENQNNGYLLVHAETSEEMGYVNGSHFFPENGMLRIADHEISGRTYVITEFEGGWSSDIYGTMANGCLMYGRNTHPLRHELSLHSVISTEATPMIQAELNRLGCNAGAVDGLIGPQTRGAVQLILENAHARLSDVVSIRMSSTNAEFNLIDRLLTDISFLGVLRQIDDAVCNPR
jgi:hypothetical protein